MGVPVAVGPELPWFNEDGENQVSAVKDGLVSTELDLSYVREAILLPSQTKMK